MIAIKVLFIGGTGVISLSVTQQLAKNENTEVYLLNRGNRNIEVPENVKFIAGDVRDENAMQKLLKDQSFDVVVNWIAYIPQHIETDLRLFYGKTGQYIFISSASVYQRPPDNYIITEETPIKNPYWQYSKDKIACEYLLMEKNCNNFPVTIVRPNYTYDKTMIPFIFNSRRYRYTIVDRMRKGKKIIVPGDGTSLFTITHSRDFAVGFCGLVGNRSSIGEAFHITSDEVKTWDQYARLIGRAAGAEPDIFHATSDMISLLSPENKGGLIGDKSYSMVYDNAKIKKYVPEFNPGITFEQGIKESVQWYDDHRHLCRSDEEFETLCDKICGIDQ